MFYIIGLSQDSKHDITNFSLFEEIISVLSNSSSFTHEDALDFRQNDSDQQQYNNTLIDLMITNIMKKLKDMTESTDITSTFDINIISTTPGLFQMDL